MQEDFRQAVEFDALRAGAEVVAYCTDSLSVIIREGKKYTQETKVDKFLRKDVDLYCCTSALEEINEILEDRDMVITSTRWVGGSKLYILCEDAEGAQFEVEVFTIVSGVVQEILDWWDTTKYHDALLLSHIPDALSCNAIKGKRSMKKWLKDNGKDIDSLTYEDWEDALDDGVVEIKDRVKLLEHLFFSSSTWYQHFHEMVWTLGSECIIPLAYGGNCGYVGIRHDARKHTYAAIAIAREVGGECVNFGCDWNVDFRI